MGLFKKINFGLRKTRNSMSGAVDNVLDSYTSIDAELFDELEEALVMGDVGVTTAGDITTKLNDSVRKKGITDPKQIREEIIEIVAEMLQGGEDMGLITVPSIILVIGVNGVGKTTTIGKMAAMYKAQGKKVIMAAADTFRAAAIDQLQIWADRAGVEIVKHKEGADPAAVIFDTISAAKSRNCDIIICDTAGRLHNKKNLMNELEKIYKVIDRELPYSDREVLLVLDATTGQNAINQAKEFKNIAEITGIALTKLDGTARGGVVLGIKNDLNIPVKFVGVGEGIDDLQPFNPVAFAKGLFESLPEDFEEDEPEYIEVMKKADLNAKAAEQEELAEILQEETQKLEEEPEEKIQDIEETQEKVQKDTQDTKEQEDTEKTDDTEETKDEEKPEEDGKKKKGFFGRIFG